MMLRKTGLVVLVSLAVTATICITACKKSATPPEERKEYSPQYGQAETHGAEVITENAREAPVVIDEKNEYLVVVRREQLTLQANVQEEIDRIDHRLMDLRSVQYEDGVGYIYDPTSSDAKLIGELLRKREMLKEDMATIERSDERGWDEIKATIERHLAFKGRS